MTRGTFDVVRAAVLAAVLALLVFACLYTWHTARMANEANANAVTALNNSEAYNNGVLLGEYDRMRGVPIDPQKQCHGIYTNHSRYISCVAGASAVLKANGQAYE